MLTPGGLAIYSRHVSEWLASEHGTAVTVARFARDHVPLLRYAYRERPRIMGLPSGVEIRIIAPSRVSVPGLHMLSRTLGRRKLDWLMLRVMRLAFGRALDRAIPPTTEVVHVVGGAWELLGFAALQVAHRRGMGFSICPAIHPGRWGDGPLDARLLTAADVVFALSEHEAATVHGLGVRRDCVRVTPLGPAVPAEGDGTRFRAKHELGTAPIVLFIGRRSGYKGLDCLIESLPVVRRDVPGARLVAIGSGEPPKQRADGLHDLGAVGEQEKADALAACDVFCMPSSREAFGMVYVEAWSYAKPVVVGPAPAVRELVEHGRTGLHADQDPHAIARALATLLSDPALARRMGEAGQRLQRERYSWPCAWRVHTEGFVAARRRAASAHGVRGPGR